MDCTDVSKNQHRSARIILRTISSLGCRSVCVFRVIICVSSDGLNYLASDNLPEVTKAIKPVLGEYYNYDSTVSF